MHETRRCGRACDVGFREMDSLVQKGVLRKVGVNVSKLKPVTRSFIAEEYKGREVRPIGKLHEDINRSDRYFDFDCVQTKVY